jgi:signal transduction histidine kinase
MDNNMESLSK